MKSELGKLKALFARGKKTYSAYQANGCTYLYAKVLKSNNKSIIEILIAIYSHLPAHLQNDTLELIHHIDVWTSLWECHEKEMLPIATDKFMFHNTVNYPAEAEQNLLNYYESL